MIEELQLGAFAAEEIANRTVQQSDPAQRMKTRQPTTFFGD
jgi:hypothetical protein